MEVFWKLALLPLAFAALLPAQQYVVSTVAGNGPLQATTGGGAAVNARLVNPRYVAVDAAGAVYFSDVYFNQVFRIDSGGTLAVVAGTGAQGSTGDGGPGTAALLDSPGPLAVDRAGDVYIGDQANGRIRRVTPAGVISTFANGVGSVGGLAFDAAGNLAFTSGNQIRRIAPDGALTAIAGSATAGFAGDGAAALGASLNQPSGLRYDSDGNLYFADSQNHRIRRIAAAGGTISTIAGDGNGRYAGENGPAVSASLALPSDVALDAAGNIYVVDASNGRIRIINRQGVIATFAGGGGSFLDGPANQALLAGLTSIAVDSQGALFVALATARQIRRIAQQNVATVAGRLPTGAGAAAPAVTVPLLGPLGIAVDSGGNLFIADQIDHRILRVTPAGSLTPFAGNGFFGTDGNNGPAQSAQVGNPRGLAFDPAGNLWLTSGAGATLRRITPAGVVATIAGNGAGFGGDGGPAVAAQFLNPIGVGSDGSGNIFVADSGNHRLRRIDAAALTISTFAGTGTAGFSGDGGSAGAVQFSSPRFTAFDRAGNLYIADSANHRVRRITPALAVTTVAGNGTGPTSGDGGPATAAGVGSPQGIAVDEAGHLYIATGNRVRRVDAATQIITTIAGTGGAGFSGDEGLATSAQMDTPLGLAVDASGAVYFVDARNFRVRKLTPARIVPAGVTNGATIRAGAVAPGEIITIFGVDLGPTPAQGLRLDAAGRVASDVGGTRVLFDGVAAPLLYVSATQVNAVVPYQVGGASTRLQVIYDGRPTNTLTLPVTATSPGVFAVANQDGSVNTAANPAAAGSVLILYATGEGRTDPPSVDGTVATAVFPKPLAEISVRIGGRAANVLYAGAAPGFVAGVLQINVTLPAGLAGAQALQVQAGDAVTPDGLRVNIR